jgi:hypothetical protein
MRDVKIRGEPIVVKVATPRDGGTDHRGRPPKHPKSAPRPKRPRGRHVA